jgi:hypothetical protein
MNEPLLLAVGGGGTTVLDGSGMAPPASWRTDEGTFAAGGGGTTEGAGKFSFGFRVVVRSGAETGGGTTVAIVCAERLENPPFTAEGAAGITFAASEGAERARSWEMLGAGATTDGLREGAKCARSRATLGAGGMTAGARAGATRGWSRETLIVGAGGIKVALRFGAVSGWSRETEGAGAITDSTGAALRV